MPARQPSSVRRDREGGAKPVAMFVKRWNVDDWNLRDLWPRRARILNRVARRCRQS